MGPDAPLIALPLTELIAVDGVVLPISGLAIANVDNDTALVRVNITSMSSSVLAFANSDSFASNLFFQGTNAEIAALLSPLRFITSAAQRVTTKTTHLVAIEVTSEARVSQSALVVTVLPGNRNDDTSLDRVIIAAVAAASAAALFFGAVGALVLYKRRTSEPRMPPPPNFDRFVYAGIVAPPRKVDARTAADFVALLKADNYALLFAVLHVTTAADADALARHLVHLFESESGAATELIVTVLNREVELIDDGALLLRSTSYAAKMMGTYARLVGLGYLYETIGPKLMNIAVEDANTELDPAKVRRRDEEIDVRVNTWKLLSISQEILKAVLESLDRVPLELRTVAYNLKRAVDAAFPERRSVALGAFFFVRFVVPAIAQPELSGLLPSPPSRESRRLLVLVAKTLQNVANRTTFKEEHLAPLNVFITSNEQPVAEFLDDLATVPANKSPGPPIAVPATPRDAAQAFVFEHTVANRSEISALVDAEPSPQLQRMRDELNRICAASPANPASARTPNVLAPPPTAPGNL
eukprot:Amastigsp_a849163_12.p1 type:complete len:529 gc:universal Amastigsp_a849163_12:1-1587(+)